MAIVYLGLGSNLGDRERNLNRALKELERLNSLEVLKKSSLYETEPVGLKEQNWFLNAVIKMKARIPPLSLLYLLKGIEKKLGRGKGEKWGPRKIDLDLLLYDSVVMNGDKLILPHPRMHKRRFVLIPLLELDKRARHPALDLTFKRLLENIEENQEVKLFSRKWKS